MLVGVERTAERTVFLRIVEDQCAETLTAFIQRHVAPGSKIITDCWKGYQRLESLRYTHITVNHSETFKDEETGECTSTVEGTNCEVKTSFPPRKRTADCEVSLWEFVWRRKNAEKPWDSLIEALI